ncbi:MAG: hypothetical protein KC473_10975, partial [Candidatus Dadabacteria bacterium]|nr:hypothetical protein [Candidatus Dadabacteria bacterium]
MRTASLYTALLLLLALTAASCKSGGDENKTATKEDSATTSESPGADSQGGEPVEGDWLIYHIGAEPGTLNPIVATDAYESVINGGNIYETLIERDNATLELKPLLAESW